jgi:hypothetical protein
MNETMDNQFYLLWKLVWVLLVLYEHDDDVLELVGEFGMLLNVKFFSTDNV